jgi:hypothetical protein
MTSSLSKGIANGFNGPHTGNMSVCSLAVSCAPRATASGRERALEVDELDDHK